MAKKEDRKVVLLRAAYDLLKKQDDTVYGWLNLLAETVPYDGTDCDGYCLMEDIASELCLEKCDGCGEMDKLHNHIDGSGEYWLCDTCLGKAVSE